MQNPKLFRHRSNGQSRPGILYNSQHYDIGDIINDYNRDFFEDHNVAKWASSLDISNLKELNGEIDFDAPIYRPDKVVCVGLNYRKHAEESGMDVPTQPVVFFKAPSSINGPFDDIVIPKGSVKTDWEVELAVVIGQKANYVNEENALDYVAGYTVHNDVSEREFQLERGGQWVKGKSADTFAPIGPYITLKADVPNPNNLNLWLKLNGKKVQDGNTSDFIFNVQQVVSYLSQYMSLMPGDIITTGTPSGVGLGFDPPQYLKSGDVVELGIEGLGTSKQNVKSYQQ